MAMEITNNYGGSLPQNAAESVKKKETEKPAANGRGGSKNKTEYVNELAKLVPSVEFRVGNSFAAAKSGKTLTVDPRLLEKMQKDPEKEREMKELIKGVETAVNMIDNVCRASGWTVVFKHGYIDENGKYRSVALLRNDFMLNMSEKLREERKEDAEELIEGLKEKAAEEKEELEEALEERKEEIGQEARDAEQRTGDAEHKTREAEQEIGNANKKPEGKFDKVGEGGIKTENGGVENDRGNRRAEAEKLIKDKIAASRDGMIYLYDTDLRTIMEADKEEGAGRTDERKKAPAGANLDLMV